MWEAIDSHTDMVVLTVCVFCFPVMADWLHDRAQDVVGLLHAPDYVREWLI
jgi:hypothetical protein